MKVKKYNGGGSLGDNRSVTRREADRKKISAEIKKLEAQIAKVKGTPAAKPLVQKYRSLTKTK